MTTLTCPVCGSEKMEKVVNKSQMPIPYGKPAEFEEHFDKCLNCGEYGDYSGENDSIGQTIEIAKKNSVATILDYLSCNGYSLSYIERSLELPQRTTLRWKRGEVSAASVALLRIVRTYPWILEIADSNFNIAVAQKLLIEEAFNMAHRVLVPFSTGHQISLSVGQNKLQLNAEYSFPPQASVAIEG